MAIKKKLVLRSIDDLKPAPYNPRKIKVKAASGLGESLKRFGDVGGIVWNSKTGNLVCGHQRVEQLREQGAELKDEALELDGKRWPVRIVDWTLEREKTANVAANNPHIAGEFSDGLGDILTDIQLSISDEDFTGLRFDVLDKALLSQGVDQDVVPEPPKRPVTKLGDVWDLGRHRVLCGDALTTKKPHGTNVTIFDPPYDLSPEQQARIVNDEASPSFLFSRGYFAATILRDIARDCWHCFAWGTRTIATGLSYELPVIQHQQIWVFADRRKKTNWAAGKHINDDWKKPHDFFELPYGGKGHVERYAKPVPLMAFLIDLFKDTTAVRDPFLGAGTTLVAAEQLGRVCHGIELEPRYVDVTVERWQNLTGNKAKRKKA